MTELNVDNMNVVEMEVQDADNIGLAEDSTTRIIEAISPTATAERVENGVKITITDKNGTTTATAQDGTDGDDSYVYIKYSAEEPTQDSDMKDTADEWMGIYSGSSTSAPTTYTSYTWYKIKGTQGEQGDPGEQGEPGEGVPAGGTAGLFLKKSSSTDYDTEWASVPDPQTMTGATSTTAGTGGLVPAPAAGANVYFLKGDGTWAVPAGGKLIVKDLDTVTNTSGSYTHTTTISDVSSDMKAVMIELGNPDAFLDTINVTTADGSITLACNSVAGTSTVKVSLLFIAGSDSITSSEFDVLAARIGTLSSLTTTDKSSVVAAVNELDSDIGTMNGKLFSPTTYTVASISELNTALSTVCSGLNEKEMIRIAIRLYGGSFEPYNSGQWECELWRLDTGYYAGFAYSYKEGRNAIQLKCNNGTWTHDELALNSKIENPVYTLSITSSAPSTWSGFIALMNKGAGTYYISTSSATRTTLKTAGIIPTTDAGTFVVTYTASNLLTMEYAPYTGSNRYTASYDQNGFKGWEMLALNSKISTFHFYDIPGSGASNNALKITLDSSNPGQEYKIFVFGIGVGNKTYFYTLYARQSTGLAVVQNVGTQNITASISGNVVTIKGDVYMALAAMSNRPITITSAAVS